MGLRADSYRNFLIRKTREKNVCVLYAECALSLDLVNLNGVNAHCSKKRFSIGLKFFQGLNCMVVLGCIVGCENLRGRLKAKKCWI
ncbi:MAG: hypothetical protein CMF70_12520 [Magnetovibrio sp.]|nr:hypothetical protein [Magnetovibrio sp.]